VETITVGDSSPILLSPASNCSQAALIEPQPPPFRLNKFEWSNAIPTDGPSARKSQDYGDKRRTSNMNFERPNDVNRSPTSQPDLSQLQNMMQTELRTHMQALQTQIQVQMHTIQSQLVSQLYAQENQLQTALFDAQRRNHEELIEQFNILAATFCNQTQQQQSVIHI
jgi:hypothetical protein